MIVFGGTDFFTRADIGEPQFRHSKNKGCALVCQTVKAISVAFMLKEQSSITGPEPLATVKENQGERIGRGWSLEKIPTS